MFINKKIKNDVFNIKYFYVMNNDTNTKYVYKDKNCTKKVNASELLKTDYNTIFIDVDSTTKEETGNLYRYYVVDNNETGYAKVMLDGGDFFSSEYVESTT